MVTDDDNTSHLYCVIGFLVTKIYTTDIFLFFSAPGVSRVLNEGLLVRGRELKEFNANNIISNLFSN